MIAKPHDIYRPGRSAGSVKKLYLGVVLVGAVVYALTAQTGVSWQDSGMHQWRVANGQLTNPGKGLALAHPLYIVMCQPIRWLAGDDLPVWMNRLSGLGMSIALANVFLLGYWLTGRRTAGLMAAAMLGVSHTAWWLATIAETYCWVVAGLTGELVLLAWLIAQPKAWKLLLLALINGLGLSLHNFALLPLPVYVVAAVILMVQRRLRWWVLPAAGGCWLVGAGLFLSLIGIEVARSGDLVGTVRWALFGSNWQTDVLNVGASGLRNSGLYLALNWPWLSLAPVLIGWWLMGRQVGRGIGSALGAVAAIELIFAIRYPVADQFMFLLPSHALLAIGAAVGINRILAMSLRARRVAMGLLAASVILTPALYGAGPWLLDRAGYDFRLGRRLPYRNEARYWITPWKFDESSAERFARDSLRRAGAAAPAVILADQTSAYPLILVQRLDGLGRDVQVDWPARSELSRYMPDPQAYRDRLDGRALFAVDAKPLPLDPALRQAVSLDEAYPLLRLGWADSADPSSIVPPPPPRAGGEE